MDVVLCTNYWAALVLTIVCHHCYRVIENPCCTWDIYVVILPVDLLRFLPSSLNFNIDSFDATKPPAHPDNGDGVSSWNVRKPSHLDMAVSPRKLHWTWTFFRDVKRGHLLCSIYSLKMVLHKSAKESTQISPTYLSINFLMSVPSPTPVSSHHLLLHSVCVCLVWHLRSHVQREGLSW